MSYRDARNLLNEMFRRINENICTPKMSALLMKHGYDGERVPRDKASQIIDAIKRNGWRAPSDLFPEYKITPTKPPTQPPRTDEFF